MDTTQFIGVSDDGLYFTKKEICLPIVQIQWRNFFCKSIIAIHSELEEIIEKKKIFRANYGEDVPIENHPLIEVLRAVINPLKEQSPLLKSIKRDCIFYI
jgi:dihydroorotase